MKTTIRRPVIKQCPYRLETDAGELVIVFDGAAPELPVAGRRVDASVPRRSRMRTSLTRWLPWCQARR